VTRALRHQDGSIPLVLTVAILVGGVVAAMFATIIGTQRVVRFDRSHSEAITSADAGLQQAVT
jgi:Tfp pilus assembly protein PilX